MEKIDLKENYEESLKIIWNNEQFKNIDVVKRGFTAPREISKNGILYIGINPSFSENSVPENSFYDVYSHKYFKKFHDISKVIEIKWSHLDLLFLKETNQNKIYEIINDKENGGLDFIWQQLMISKKIIEESKPKLIVVNNTLARKFLGKDQNNGKENWMDFKFSEKINEDLGTHTFNEGVMKGVPIFFSSMFTGQRALDLGSFERLVWHMNFVLKKIS